MLLSIIIATHNRAGTLTDALTRILNQKTDGSFEYELILVDNNSNDNTKTIVESFAARIDGRLRYLFESKRGKSNALNKGIKEARGEIIVFTDDDVIADPSWLMSIVQCFKIYQCDFAGGRVLPLYQQETPQWIKDNADILAGPIVRYDFGENVKRLEKFQKPFHEFIGANFALKKELFEEVGMFRADLGPGTGTMGEDTEFIKRLVKKNKIFYYCGKAVVWHPVDLKRMNLSYIAQWSIAFGRYGILVSWEELLNKKLRYYFDIPRYLIREIIENGLALCASTFNKRRFLQEWSNFFIHIGWAIQIRRLYRKQTNAQSPATTVLPANDKLRICFLCRTFHRNRGGTESYTYRMAKALARKGHEVHIVAESGHEKYFLKNMGGDIVVHKVERLSDHLFRGSWRLERFLPLNRLRYTKTVAQKLDEILLHYPLDIIESAEWGIECYAFQKRKRLPTCVRLHGYHGLKEAYDRKKLKRDIKKRIFRNLERRVILNAEAVTSIADDFTKFAREVWNLPRKEITLIKIGIDREIFRPSSAPKENMSVLFVGRLEETKGIEVLAKAIPQILKVYPTTKFYFAGKDMLRQDTGESWYDYILKLAPNQNLNFLGQLSMDELVDYYQHCAVGVFPSLYEPAGTVHLEAMACGCVSIVTEVGGFPEAVKNGVNGLLIPPRDPEALANAVIRLLADDHLRTTLAQNALDTIRNEYDLNNIADQTLAIYRKTINLFKRTLTLL